MTGFQFFMPIAKVDAERRTVSGYASTPTEDNDGEIVTLDAVRDALPDYMEYGNIREMHALKAVGVAQEANVDTKGLYLTAKIVDEAAWAKCLEGVYKGFSIGGRKLAKTGNKITSIEMTEISVVDRPANPDARFTLAKSAKILGEASGYLLKVKKLKSLKQDDLVKMMQIVTDLTKTDTLLTKQEETDTNNKHCALHNELDCDKCALELVENNKEPYGDVEYADNGLQSDGKKRYPVNTEEHIRAAWSYINKPKNAAKYGSKVSVVTDKIIEAWKNKIDKDGPPARKETKVVKKLTKVKLDGVSKKRAARTAKELAFYLNNNSFLKLRKNNYKAPVFKDQDLILTKNMSAAAALSSTFDAIRTAQRMLLLEAKREGGDMKDKELAIQLGKLAKDIATIISQKATHEGAEAMDLSDADDAYVSSILQEDLVMTKTHTTNVNSDAVSALMKRATMPTRAQRVEAASVNVTKARKACKEARENVEEVHKMLKAAYLAKMHKTVKKQVDDDDDDAEEFDHADAMEKLQKAFGSIEKARTMAKAANTQLAKAMTRSGQQGQEAGDAEPGFFDVPAGLTNLTPADMAGAAPGSKFVGSQPPLYPVDGSVYAGKANEIGDLQKYSKNGQVSADVVELIMQKARAEGELEALRKMPAASSGRRPYAFDTTKVMAGTSDLGNFGSPLNKTLFNDVDPNDLNSPDERIRSNASAKVAGNFILSGNFGRSVFDPSFNGAAGSAR